MSSPDMSAETQGTAIQEREPKPRASFQFVMSPSEVEKLHGALYVAPQAEIYNGQFIDPFSSLVMIVAKRQNQLVMQAEVEVDESFNLRYGSTIGDSEALKTLQKRYPQHQLSGDGTTFIALRKDQPVGVIQRVDEDRIIVRRGANAGPITLSEDHPVNDLKMEMDQFLLLTQRYVTSLMQASDGNHREVNLVLDLPQLTEGALATYYSSFEIMAREFRARHRTLDLATEIGGFEKVKTVMRSLFIDLTDPDTSRKFGNQPFSNRFVLITGAHGTGKSLFPKALDTMLSDRFGKNFEHFRLPLNDMLRKYGGSTATIVNTILDHIRENERKGITTALHIDNLEALCPPDEQAGHAVLVKHMQINEPVVTAIREFGNDLGPASHHVVVIGESQVPSQTLPEGIQRVFRSSYSLHPTRQDLADALVVQVAKTRKFARGSGINPVDNAVDKDPLAIIPETEGLTGKDIQDAILNITHRNKTSGKSPRRVKITPADIAAELANIQIERSLTQGRRVRSLGFNTKPTH